jgi:hypothetical protein
MDPTLISTSGPTDHFGWLLDPTVAGRPKSRAQSFYRASSITLSPNISNRYNINFPSGTDMSDFEKGDRFTYHQRVGHNVLVNGDGSGYVFQNITTYSSNAFAFLVTAQNDFGPDFTISDVEFNSIRVETLNGRWRSTNGDGVHFLKVDDIKVNNSYFTGLSDDAIALKSSNNWQVTNSTMNNKRRYGINVVSQPSGGLGGIISNNTIEYNGGFGIYSSGTTSNISETNNNLLMNELSAGEFIVDEGRFDVDGTFSDVSSSWIQSGLSGYDGSSTLYANSSPSIADWSLDVPMNGDYQIRFFKVVHPNSDSNAKVTVSYNGGTYTEYLNLRQGPSGWFTLNSGIPFPFTTSSPAVVTLERGNSNSRADAVMFKVD